MKAVFWMMALLAGGAQAGTVRIGVHGVLAGKGAVAVALCTKEQFRKRCAFHQVLPADAGTVTLQFVQVPAGRYAVRVYQDEDGNGKLDVDVLGMPREGYGFSRDAQGRFGPPRFEDAAFEVGEEMVAIALTLRR